MRSVSVLAMALVVTSLMVAPARPGQAADSDVPYALSSPPSEFEWGCFGPCACPVLVQSPLKGSFLLHPSHSDPLFTYYDVLDVRCEVPGTNGPVTITGSGTYRRGGEVAVEEELTLDLSFGGAPPQHFDSGLKSPGAAFPEIDTRISLHQEYCHDSVLTVDAKPAAVAGVGGAPQASSIVMTPNPFTGATTIGFTMPREGPARLTVCDIAGRRARTLVDRERLPSGPSTRTWDGRIDSGLPAPPGLYVVLLDTPAGRSQRLLVKLR